uniref:Uncharacterized protein n=1 Tax=Arundo donax TaxID=35708 RepID=A0A0A9BYZ3_ARUDO
MITGALMQVYTASDIGINAIPCSCPGLISEY